MSLSVTEIWEKMKADAALQIGNKSNDKPKLEQIKTEKIEPKLEHKEKPKSSGDPMLDSILKSQSNVNLVSVSSESERVQKLKEIMTNQPEHLHENIAKEINMMSDDRLNFRKRALQILVDVLVSNTISNDPYGIFSCCV